MALQLEVPVAVPEPMSVFCHVTVFTPTLSEAPPVTVIVDWLVCTMVDAGDWIDRVGGTVSGPVGGVGVVGVGAGAVGALLGAVRVIWRDWVVV